MARSLEAKVYAVPPSVSVQRESADGTRVVYSAVHRQLAGCRGAWVVPAELVGESWQPSHDWKTRARSFKVWRDETDPALWRCSASFDFAEVSPDGLDALLLFIGLTPPPIFRKLGIDVERQLEAIASAFEINREAPWQLESGRLRRPLGARTGQRLMSAGHTFLLAACQYPGGMLDHRDMPLSLCSKSPVNLPGPADRSLARMADVIDTLNRAAGREIVNELVLAGDQVYVDATAGLFDPLTRDDPVGSAYRARLRNTWRSRLPKELKIIAAIDDHEIEDNWEPSCHPGRDAVLRGAMEQAREQFIRNQRNGERAPAVGDSRVPLWRTDRLGPHLLFVGDTRTERDARDPERIERARIMSTTQRDALHQALLDDQRADGSSTRVKFILTPAMPLPRRLGTAEADTPAAALRSDAWDGYPGSLFALLAFLTDNQLQNCVFLSGNEHIGCIAKATLQRMDDPSMPAVTLWSVHAGAMYAPYPFANAIAEDFADTERFEFRAVRTPGTPPGHYACSVQTWFPDVGDGFVRVNVLETVGGGARLAVTFHDGQDPGRDASWSG